jgi:hypothetical protein
LAYILTAIPNIRHLLLSCLAKVDVDALRQISRDVRAAVNDNVSTVKVQLDPPRCHHELAAVFPYANRLHISLYEGINWCDAADEWDFDERDPWESLVDTLATSPALLANLQALKLDLGDERGVDGTVPGRSVARFLTRCGQVRRMVRSAGGGPVYPLCLVDVSQLQHACLLCDIDHAIPLCALVGCCT